jgi:hypothetical protein
MMYLVVISFTFWMSSDLVPIKKDYELPPEHSTKTYWVILYVEKYSLPNRLI